jgi:hypothetical protein
MEDRSMDPFRIHFTPVRSLLGCALALMVVVMFHGPVSAAENKIPPQQTFQTPEAAVKALVTALRGNVWMDIYTLFGPGSGPLIASGDRVADKERRAKFTRLYGEKNRLEAVGKAKVVLHVGNDDWPFPIPLVRSGKNWRFDTKQGKEEILNRRIGKNELDTIQTCMAIVDAQREYATMDRDGSGLMAYAQKFFSTGGTKDGLYWEVSPGEKPSPLGPFAAKAQSEGYRKEEKPAPYNGYFFRILTEQGKDARGGAYSYLVKGKMIGGFGLVAYPAVYGASGVKTFIVNHEGIVYEKDLGPSTVEKAKSMKAFNPDKTWEKAD